jgi:hypothetical protein
MTRNCVSVSPTSSQISHPLWQDLLKPITHRIPHARNRPAIVQPPYPFRAPSIPRNCPRADRRQRDLGAAFDELGRRGDDEGGETAEGAGAPDFVEILGVGWGVGEEGEGAVVGDEEDGVEGAIA